MSQKIHRRQRHKAGSERAGGILADRYVISRQGTRTNNRSELVRLILIIPPHHFFPLILLPVLSLL